jgi:hypothetical protein
MGRSKINNTVSTLSRNRGLTPWKPGQCGNPNGRPMGSRQRITDKFINDLADHYEREGHKAIERVLEENPVAYLQIVCRLLPKDVSLTVTQDPSNSLPPEQLKRIAEAWLLSQHEDEALEGESVVVSSEIAALPAPVADPMLVPDRVQEQVKSRMEFEDRTEDEDSPIARKRSTRPVVRRQ